MDISNDDVFEYIKCDKSRIYNQLQKNEKRQNRDREINVMENHYQNLRMSNDDEVQLDCHKEDSIYQREEIDQRIYSLKTDYLTFKLKMEDHEAYTLSCQFYQ